jgi:hypothetical protein
LINRGGVLKDENRKDMGYSAARSIADFAASLSAKAFFAIGRSYFEHAYTVTAPPAGQGALQ